MARGGIRERDVARWLGTWLAVLVLMLAVVQVWVGSLLVTAFFSQVADYCGRLASGEPDRGDSDCHSSVNWLEGGPVTSRSGIGDTLSHRMEWRGPR